MVAAVAFDGPVRRRRVVAPARCCMWVGTRSRVVTREPRPQSIGTARLSASPFEIRRTWTGRVVVSGTWLRPTACARADVPAAVSIELGPRVIHVSGRRTAVVEQEVVVVEGDQRRRVMEVPGLTFT